MDKLKPILAQKFWILFGVALLVPVIGWWMDTAFLAGEIKVRQDAIKKAFDATNVSSDVPNDSWKAELDKINNAQTEQLKASARRLWESQRGLMVWPPELAALLKDVPIRGPIPNQATDIYRNSYFREIERIRQIVQPKDRERPDAKYLTILSPTAIKHIPASKWQFLPPASDEMWDAQEEVWLWDALMRAIASVNGEATNIAEAAIREIHVVDQMGGTLKVEAPAASGAAGAAGAAAGPAAAGAAATPADAGASPFGGGSLTGGAIDRKTTATFDPKEEFGSGEKAAESSGAAGGAAAPAGASAAAVATPGGTGGGTAAKIRYVDEDPNLPYKLRAFYVQVTMDHRKVPDLLAALTNMPYPVQIVRVQQVSRSEESGAGDSRLAGPAAGPAVAAGVGAGVGAAVGAGGGDLTEKETAERAERVALSDPYLADVAIAGLMTLYQPPKVTDDPNAPNPAAATPPVGATPAAPETPAATPVPPAETAQPAEVTPAVPATPGKKPGTPAAPEASQSETPKPETAKPPEAKPPVPGAADPKPADPKPDAKPADANPTEPGAATSKTEEAKPAEPTPNPN